jgi:hypothetical protein
MQRHNDLTQTMLIPAINGRISGIFLKGIPEYGDFKITLKIGRRRYL